MGKFQWNTVQQQLSPPCDATSWIWCRRHHDRRRSVAWIIAWYAGERENGRVRVKAREGESLTSQALKQEAQHLRTTQWNEAVRITFAIYSMEMRCKTCNGSPKKEKENNTHRRCVSSVDERKEVSKHKHWTSMLFNASELASVCNGSGSVVRTTRFQCKNYRSSFGTSFVWCVLGICACVLQTFSRILGAVAIC